MKPRFRSQVQVKPPPSSSGEETFESATQALVIRTDKQPTLFARLTPSQRNRVIACGVRLSLSEDEVLFAQGGQHKGVYLIQSGLIRTFYTSPAGREITLAYWQQGNIVGTPQVFGPGIHMWSGIAVADTQILAFRGEIIRDLMQRIPALAIGVVEALEFKGQCLSTLVQMLGTRSVAERLAMLLCSLADLHGVREKEGVAIGQPFTHEVLAQMVGASRQWVTMTLDRFQREGLICIAKRRTVILKRKKLLSRPSSLSD
jgi:CRP/FNR family transcriptional regulator, cyclic AMP receptor protein